MTLGVLMLAVCGFLLGGVWSFHKQGRRGAAVILGAAAVIAGVAAVLWLVGEGA